MQHFLVPPKIGFRLRSSTVNEGKSRKKKMRRKGRKVDQKGGKEGRREEGDLR